MGSRYGGVLQYDVTVGVATCAGTRTPIHEENA